MANDETGTEEERNSKKKIEPEMYRLLVPITVPGQGDMIPAGTLVEWLGEDRYYWEEGGSNFQVPEDNWVLVLEWASTEEVEPAMEEAETEDEEMMSSKGSPSMGDECPKCEKDVLVLEHHGMLECQACSEVFEYREAPDDEAEEAEEDGELYTATVQVAVRGYSPADARVQWEGFLDEAKAPDGNEKLIEKVGYVSPFSLPTDEPDSSISEVMDALENIEVVARERSDRLQAMTARPVKATLGGGDKAFIILCIGVMLTLPWVLAKAVFMPAAPVVSVAAPEVTINGSEIVDSLMTRRLDYDSRTGLYMPLPEGVDDEAGFRTACIDICAAESLSHYRMSRPESRERMTDGRVLVNEPEHQICTCFTGRHVVRWVGWNRR